MFIRHLSLLSLVFLSYCLYFQFWRVQNFVPISFLMIFFLPLSISLVKCNLILNYFLLYVNFLILLFAKFFAMLIITNIVKSHSDGPQCELFFFLKKYLFCTFFLDFFFNLITQIPYFWNFILCSLFTNCFLSVIFFLFFFFLNSFQLAPGLIY